MDVSEHFGFATILAAMKALDRGGCITRWRRTIFRAAPPKWSSGRLITSGIGAQKAGGRFNAPGTFAAVYASTSPELAVRESLAYQRRANLPPELALPLVVKAIEVKVGRAIDLNTEAIVSKLEISSERIKTDPWWVYRAKREESFTQAIGRAAHRCGVQAILAPSSQEAGAAFNVFVLPDHIQLPSYLKVLRGSVGR
jgi:RES domain-containing protein